jgi:hypothetical protein
MALGVAALYHWRRWLEEPRSRQIYSAAVFALTAVLTYLPVAVLGLVMLAWVFLMGRARYLLERRTLGIAAIGVLPLAAWALVAAKWAPSHGAVAMLEGVYPFWAPAAWAFYLFRLPMLLSAPVLVLLALSALLWVTLPSLRREMAFCGLWFALCYIWFSAISVKETRYALLLVPPSVCLGVSVSVGGLRALAPRIRPSMGQLVPGVLLLILALHLGLGARVVVPKVSGFDAIIAFLKETAPSEFVFYDGEYAGVFSFYVRAQDDHFAQGVVLGSKLLYAARIEARYGLVQLASTPDEVVARLRRHCGCRLVIVERRLAPGSEDIPVAHSLRTALNGGQFRFVRSFKLITPEMTEVDIYEQLGPITYPDSIELPFPALGGGITYQAKPIRRSM